MKHVNYLEGLIQVKTSGVLVSIANLAFGGNWVSQDVGL